ncbi:MAG: glycoside hydrolase family 57 protein [Muribaculaceae bacterium]|jgi:alpha-amylase|nr:glycoside hydrolase family 57 protein [Muribaculaceae bacterium]
MKAICFYFQIHQPFRLKQYRFFDIGNDSSYYDFFANEDIIQRIARKSYIPANNMLLEMINANKGKFKVAFSITGTALEQFQMFVPEFNDSMMELVKTGCVEFLSETFSHSLCSLYDPDEFQRQVKLHDQKIFELYKVHPVKVFRNTELIYDDDISAQIHAMGFKGAITEGAKHILGWKSPNYVYSSAMAPKLKLLLKNSKLSDDISFRFSNTEWPEFPLTADKYIDWIATLPPEEQIINLFMNYETFGELQPKESGIFEFMKALPRFAQEKGIEFWTPSEAIAKLKSVGELSVPYAISWADEARDTSAWCGNTLQQEALKKLYSDGERVRMCTGKILEDWNYLQSSDHFFYMSTKHKDDGAVHSHYSPYDTPYQAFTNYMNVLSDFLVRVQEQYPMSIGNEELNSLLTTIKNQESEIEQLNREVELMRTNIIKAEDDDLVTPKQVIPADKVAETTDNKDTKKPTAKPAAKKPAKPAKKVAPKPEKKVVPAKSKAKPTKKAK